MNFYWFFNWYIIVGCILRIYIFWYLHIICNDCFLNFIFGLLIPTVYWSCILISTNSWNEMKEPVAERCVKIYSYKSWFMISAWNSVHFCFYSYVIERICLWSLQRLFSSLVCQNITTPYAFSSCFVKYEHCDSHCTSFSILLFSNFVFFKWQSFFFNQIWVYCLLDGWLQLFTFTLIIYTLWCFFHLI